MYLYSQPRILPTFLHLKNRKNIQNIVIALDPPYRNPGYSSAVLCSGFRKTPLTLLEARDSVRLAVVDQPNASQRWSIFQPSTMQQSHTPKYHTSAQRLTMAIRSRNTPHRIIGQAHSFSKATSFKDINIMKLQPSCSHGCISGC